MRTVSLHSKITGSSKNFKKSWLAQNKKYQLVLDLTQSKKEQSKILKIPR